MVRLLMFIISLSLQEAFRVLKPLSRKSFSIFIVSFCNCSSVIIHWPSYIQRFWSKSEECRSQTSLRNQRQFSTDIRFSGSVEKQKKYNSHIRIYCRYYYFILFIWYWFDAIFYHYYGHHYKCHFMRATLPHCFHFYGHYLNLNSYFGSIKKNVWTAHQGEEKKKT